MSSTLSDRVAVITGSTGGLGEGIARRLVEEGLSVVISGRRTTEGEQVAASVREMGGRALFVKADVAIEADCVHLIQQAIDHFGRVDVLVNNAAITPNEPRRELPVEMWDQVFAVNVRGAFICSREAIRVMQRQGGGRIINIGSTVPFRGTMERLAYGCSKGALFTLTKMMARDLLQDKILVNWITVGWVATPGEVHLRNLVHGDGKAFLDSIGQKAPLGRLETVEDIAAAVAFLVSEEASHITGCDLNVSGGLWF